MFNIKKYLFFALLKAPFVFSIQMHAFHINGINTSQLEAQKNLVELVNTAAVNSNMVLWDTLYNKSTDLWSDLADAFNQKAQENQNITLDDFVLLYMKTNGLHYESDSSDYSNLKASISEKFVNDPQYSGRNLDAIIADFNRIVPDNENSYVLLIPHSQGNLYATQLYNYLTSTKSYNSRNLSIVGIANTTKLGDLPVIYPYITSSNDLVIKALSLLYTVLGANTIAQFSISDVLGHNLIDIYLTDSTTKALIKQNINQALDMFSFYIGAGSYYMLDFKKEYGTLPITLLHDNKLIYENSTIIDGANFLYYYPSEYATYTYKTLLYYPMLPGKYTINVNSNQDYSQYTSFTPHIYIPYTIDTITHQVNCPIVNDIIDCAYNKDLTGINRASFMPENYLVSNKQMIMEMFPNLFPTPGLLTVHEFYIN